MIIYGTRGTLVKTEFIIGQCANCNTSNSLQLSIYQKYGHVFWIPLFPINKIGVSQCQNCMQVLDAKQLPAAVWASYDSAMRDTKPPLWIFSGLGGIAILAIALTIHVKERNKRVSAMAQKPMVNDILEVKQKDASFTRIKINGVRHDTIFFVANKFQSDQATNLSELEEKGYDTVSYVMPIKDLIEMDKRDELIDVIRK